MFILGRRYVLLAAGTYATCLWVWCIEQSLAVLAGCVLGKMYSYLLGTGFYFGEESFPWGVGQGRGKKEENGGVLQEQIYRGGK